MSYILFSWPPLEDLAPGLQKYLRLSVREFYFVALFCSAAMLDNLLLLLCSGLGTSDTQVFGVPCGRRRGKGLDLCYLILIVATLLPRWLQVLMAYLYHRIMFVLMTTVFNAPNDLSGVQAGYFGTVGKCCCRCAHRKS